MSENFLLEDSKEKYINNCKNKFTALFYMLLRDDLPMTVLTEKIQYLENNIDFIFTNKELEQLANSLVERIIDD